MKIEKKRERGVYYFRTKRREVTYKKGRHFHDNTKVLKQIIFFLCDYV